MSEISETEIKAMTKEQNYIRGYKDGMSDVLDKIKADIEEMKIEDNSHNICFKVHNDVVEIILRIIDDKYRVERNCVK